MLNNFPKTYEEFTAQKEIPRSVDVPELSRDQIEEISCTLFIDSDPKPSDIAFLFGGSDCDFVNVARLLKRGLAPLLLISGGVGREYFKTGITLAESMKSGLLACGVPESIILTSNRSTNTLEDALFGKELLAKHRIKPRSILFITKSPHSGRCLRTLQKVFPGVKLSCFTYSIMLDGQPVTRDNWWKSEEMRSRIYAEYLRIKKYSERGDIAP